MVENQSCTINPVSDGLRGEHLPHRHPTVGHVVSYTHKRVIHVIDDAVHLFPGPF